jgi:lysozyme family protein
MASFDVCYNWMLDQEDPRREYKIVPDAPQGAHAISGVNSAAFPDEYAAIASVEQSQRADLIKKFYLNHFWNKWLAQINSDEVCKRVFDFSVNAGSHAAVKCLQEAVNILAQETGMTEIKEDGCWGQNTVKSANTCGVSLISAFQQTRVAHYEAIVDAKPELAHYLPQWMARALK